MIVPEHTPVHLSVHSERSAFVRLPHQSSPALAALHSKAGVPRDQFLARDVIYMYTSRACYDVSVRLSVRLSVTEVHWCIMYFCVFLC